MEGHVDARVDDRSLSANSIMDPQELIMLMSVARAYPWANRCISLNDNIKWIIVIHILAYLK